jgi:hypothetical protein
MEGRGIGLKRQESLNLQTACLNVMEEMLSVSSELCQWTALRGLNHWHRNYSKQVERIVDSMSIFSKQIDQNEIFLVDADYFGNLHASYHGTESIHAFSRYAELG